jgi:hypothetical protein
MKFIFKFIAEFPLSLWYTPCQIYRMYTYRCTFRKHKHNFIAYCRSKQSNLLTHFSLLRRTWTERAYYKMLENVCEWKRNSRPAHKYVSESVLRSELLFGLFLLMSMHMWLLYTEPIKMIFDHDRCFKVEPMFPLRILFYYNSEYTIRMWHLQF